MIVLLNCFINLSANNNHNLSTGEIITLKDSVLIAYDDLRIVNSKLIELDYEKQINITFRNIINNDSVIINDYKNITNQLNKDCKKYINQRNIAISAGVILFITSLVLIIK